MTVWRFLKKLGIKPPYDPAIPLLSIYPEETKLEKPYVSPMLIAVLFTIARIWKQPAAAAKSLQSCLTLCDSMDGSQPGSPIHGILQERTLEWVAISFSNASKWKVKGTLFNCVWLLATPWTHHARPPCPSPTPGVHSNSHILSWWCHPAISSSVVPFSPCPQSLPASESFPMSQLFAWGGQSIGVSASASVLPINTGTGLL